ncbi:MAG: sigma-54 dependent transcriptional regulator [Treponema sp.]|jgi:two-component system nitrogen regulation response regulator NtrX|nr:sigma-54 dependent transcriptional regulator [Treponema sp.]
MNTMLVIDDEPGIRTSLSAILEDEGYRAKTAEDALVGLETLGREPIDMVLLDVLLPRMGGLEALEKIRALPAAPEVVVISGHASVDMAVRAVKLGAFDFLEKPLSLDKVLTVCRNALSLSHLKQENKRLKQNAAPADDGIIGASDAITRIRALIKQAATSDARILITGENGVGKELVAQAVHRRSSRYNKAFIEVNCAAIPDTLIESELFGHEKGAFTDAVSSRKGRFESASGGTLFLDEIGDMSLTAQAKVLRAIQEQKIERVGGEKTIDVDVRIVAATNKDLEKECEAGRFRQDLFFRLNVIPIRVPSLRERSDDVPLLLAYFLKDLGKERCEFDVGALRFLMSYDWPGNVRELRNLAERIVVLHPGERLTEDELTGLLSKTSEPEKAVSLTSRFMNLPYNEAKEAFEKQYLEYQFAKNDNVISRTAEAIGIYPSNLHAKLRKYRIKS